jgi:hypothetical protein
MLPWLKSTETITVHQENRCIRNHLKHPFFLQTANFSRDVPEPVLIWITRSWFFITQLSGILWEAPDDPVQSRAKADPYRRLRAGHEASNLQAEGSFAVSEVH